MEQSTDLDIIQAPIKTWSWSALKTFEECPFRIFLDRVKKEPKPPIDETAPNVRGKKIHDLAEKYVRGELTKLPEELQKFEKQFTDLQQRFPDGTMELEEDWGFDLEWKPTGYWDKDVWGRAKLDVFDHPEPTTGRIIDYKTGRKFGNEIAHNQQGQNYMITAFMRYTDLEFLDVEFWYTDIGEHTNVTYIREQMNLFLPRMRDRALKLTTALMFEPKPNKRNCKWCPFGPTNGTGACPHGVEQ